MNEYTTEQLHDILKQHSLWLSSKHTKGTYANLAGAYLGEANLAGASLEGAILAGAYLGGAYLGEANLAGASLEGAILAGAYLGEANLRGAYLERASLRGANLEGANLAGASLNGTDLFDIIGKEIITFQAGKHFAYYCDGHVKIGCEFHSLSHWLENYKAIGEEGRYTEKQISAYGGWLYLVSNLVA